MKILKTILITLVLLFIPTFYTPQIVFCTSNSNITKTEVNELDLFLKKLGEIETGDPKIYPYKGFKSPYHVTNEIDAWGKWQITPIARKDIKYTGTKQQFLNSKEVQKKCVIKLLKRNKVILQQHTEYEKYLGKTIQGVKITYSGLIAAAHLAGCGGVNLFLTKGYNAKERSASVKKYLKIFANYSIENKL
jgi:hypothetical protein